VIAFTSFSKVYVCLQGLKLAFSQGELFPQFVLLILSILLSLLIMHPVFEGIFSTDEDKVLIEALIKQNISTQQQELQLMAKVDLIVPKIEKFLQNNTSEDVQAKMKRLFILKEKSEKIDLMPMVYLSFAFLISEMYGAFYFILWLLIPFLLIDLMVAYLISIFQIQLQTTHLSLPIKIFLFLQIDGWLLLTEKLKLSYLV
jgi:flagellar biosynthesis protein FliP